MTHFFDAKGECVGGTVHDANLYNDVVFALITNYDSELSLEQKQANCMIK